MTGVFRPNPNRISAAACWPRPRGKVIGGSSSINGMVYVRGHARDFDTWAEMGAHGWSYADVLPYFRRMENWHGEAVPWPATPPGAARTAPCTSHAAPADNPLFDAFIEAGSSGGLSGDPRLQRPPARRLRPDGGDDLEGPALVGGQRLSETRPSSPAMFSVIRAFARRVVIENGRAVGVEVDRGGQIEVIRAACRGDPCGLVDQHAQASDAVGHRARRASGRTWH